MRGMIATGFSNKLDNNLIKVDVQVYQDNQRQHQQELIQYVDFPVLCQALFWLSFLNLLIMYLDKFYVLYTEFLDSVFYQIN